MSLNKEIQDQLEQLDKLKAEALAELEELKDEDKYWFFTPTTGNIGPDAEEFVKKWFKPEHIPATYTGQMAVFKSQAPIVVVTGGNQPGKTTVNAILAHAKVTGEVPFALQGVIPETKLPTKWPVYGRVYGLSSDVIEEVLVPKFRELMPKKYWHKSGWDRTYNRQEKMLRYFRDGKFIGQVKFMSTEKDVEKTQGVTLDFAHFDEEPPKEFYDEALPRLSRHGLDIAFFFTPTSGITWTYDTLVTPAGEPGSNIELFKIATVTNPALNLEVLAQMMKDADTYDEKRMRIFGDFVSLSGLIFNGDSAFDTNIHLVEPFQLTPENYVVFRAIDYHLSKPAAVVEFAVDRMGIGYFIGCYQKTADTEIVKRDLSIRAIDRGYRLGWSVYDMSLDYEIKAADNVNIIDKLKVPPNPIPAMFPSSKNTGSSMAAYDEWKKDMRSDSVTKKPRIYFWNTPEVWQLIKEIRTLEREKGINESKKGTRDKVLDSKKDLVAAAKYLFQRRRDFVPQDTGYTIDHEFDASEERYI